MKAFNPSTSQWEDVYVKALDSFPVGVIVEYPTTDSSKLPTGYMFCDGSAISRTEYSELFSLIGTSFGAGDGSTTFNIPTKAGLVTAGIKSSDTDFDTIGETLGEKTVTLTVDQMPSHTHSLRTAVTAGSNTKNDKPLSAAPSSSWNNNAHTELSIDLKGGNQPHNNIQPTQVSNFIIKVKPTRVLASTVVNAYNESTGNAYSSDYCNKAFGGKVLWTNPNPTSNFASQNITLSSDDYDVLKIFYKATKSGIEVFSQETLKECSGSLSQVWGGGNNTNSRVRSFTYSNVTTYNISAGYQVSGGSGSQKNDIIIPLYVIGYKTGLFN